MSLILENLNTDPQNFTTSWVDLGVEINILTFVCLTAWLDIDVNDSTSLKARLVYRQTSGGTNYNMMYSIPNGGDEDVYSHNYTFPNNIDRKICLDFSLKMNKKFAQIQIKAGVVGAAAGQILASNYSLI